MRRLLVPLALAAPVGYQLLSEDAQIIVGLYVLVVALVAAMAWLIAGAIR